MSETKWTLGPLRAVGPDVRLSAYNVSIAHCVTAGRHPHEPGALMILPAEANARLYAAAPDMAEALNAAQEAEREHAKCDCRNHSQGYLLSMCSACASSPYLHTRLRSYDAARLDIITERLMVEQAKLRNLPLDDPRQAECVRAIRALDTELDGFDDLRAT